MKWTLGILTVLLAAVNSAPGSRQHTKQSDSTNMNQEPIPIEPTTQNLFGDVVAITPPNTESIELQHLNDDIRFYPDYGKDQVDGQHFTKTPPTRTKKEDLDYEMYLDSGYSRRRRESDEEPTRIDLDIPGDFDSQSTDSSDLPTPRSPASDPDSISTQITYVTISEDDSTEDEVEETGTEKVHNATEVTDLVLSSNDQATSNSDSSASTDSFVGRNRVLRAVANTIRAKSRSNEQSQSGSVDTDAATSDNLFLTRKKRQRPYYRLPDFLNYRTGRSVSESDTDDAHGFNMKDVPMERTERRVTPLPEFAYEFAELTRPSSTYVNAELRSYYVPVRRRSKRSSEEKSEPKSTTEHLDVVTSYPLGIDATKENFSLPEGNFLGPRIYTKGDLLQEEQPAITGIAAPIEKEKSIPVLNGAKTETVYSAPVVNSMNLPLIIPVVGPTSHLSEQPRIELSVPPGYVPYIIELEPLKNQTSGNIDGSQVSGGSTLNDEALSNIMTSSPHPEVPTHLPFVPTIIVTPSTPTPGHEVPTQTEVPTRLEEKKSSEAVGAQRTSSTPATTTLELPSNLPEKESKSGSKQKRTGWKDISSAPAGEVEQPKQQTAKWEQASNAPTVDMQFSQSTSSWRSVPVGEEELPCKQTSRWEPLSNAPDGESETSTGNSDVPAESSTRDDIQEPSPQPFTSDPRSQTNCDSEISDQGTKARRERLRAGKSNQVVPILEKSSSASPNGSFSYSYKSGNGIQVEESGYLKKEPADGGVAQVVQGTYSYPAPDGRTIRVRYVADENGFHPELEDLPK